MPSATVIERYNGKNFFGVAALTTDVTNGTPGLEIVAASTGRLRIVEIRISITAPTASTFGIGRPAAKGVNPSATKLFQSMQANGAGVHSISTAWGGGTAPTIPAEFYFRGNTAATIGNFFVWQPEDLWVPPSATMVVWNAAAAPNSASNISIVIESDV